MAIYIHCLFSKDNLYSLYALLKTSVTSSPDLHIERVTMFGFPVQATKIITDAMNETVVAYNHNLTFNASNTDITDYYLPSSTESTREVMLMAVDTEGPQQG